MATENCIRTLSPCYNNSPTRRPDDDQLSDPGELLFPKDLPDDNIFQLPIGPVPHNPLCQDRADPRKPSQIFRTGPVEIYFYLRQRLDGVKSCAGTSSAYFFSA